MRCSMAAAERGWLDRERVMLESLMAFKRAGADGDLHLFRARRGAAAENGDPRHTGDRRYPVKNNQNSSKKNAGDFRAGLRLSPE